jgi:peptidase A4-like protein
MHGPTKQLARCLAACVPVIGLLMAFGPAAGASTAAAARHTRVHHTASQLKAARAELSKLLQKQHGTDSWVGADRPAAARNGAVKAQTKVQSNNWAGYADTGTGFTKVTGTWVEPSATCGSGESLAAFWVGIDGFSSNSVEQDGTLIECDGGQAFYFTWWEMFPTNAVQIVGQTLSPGDTIHASVTRTGTSYKLTVTDSTNSADSFTKTETCSNCANSSAEYIAEAPSNGTSVEALSHFSVFKLKSATVSTSSKSGVISSFTDDEITMVDSAGNVEAQPGNLNANGNFFQVTWKRST